MAAGVFATVEKSSLQHRVVAVKSYKAQHGRLVKRHCERELRALRAIRANSELHAWEHHVIRMRDALVSSILLICSTLYRSFTYWTCKRTPQNATCCFLFTTRRSWTLLVAAIKYLLSMQCISWHKDWISCMTRASSIAT